MSQFETDKSRAHVRKTMQVGRKRKLEGAKVALFIFPSAIHRQPFKSTPVPQNPLFPPSCSLPNYSLRLRRIKVSPPQDLNMPPSTPKFHPVCGHFLVQQGHTLANLSSAGSLEFGDTLQPTLVSGFVTDRDTHPKALRLANKVTILLLCGDGDLHRVEAKQAVAVEGSVSRAILGGLERWSESRFKKHHDERTRLRIADVGKSATAGQRVPKYGELCSELNYWVFWEIH
ncbi:hypothetical protein BJ742DRAFT_743200 [Cladochytrium replicatum]|nr:hypothetical protein BJ742DRAFT_743200 [Cladochytrium replicatum]